MINIMAHYAGYVMSLTKFAAAPAQSCQEGSFFFLPVWWKYLETSADCSVIFDFPGDIWAVGLAILDILLRIAGFVAVIMIIVAGIRYMGSGGNPEKAASARRSLYNAIIGLLIALTATLVVGFVGNRLV